MTTPPVQRARLTDAQLRPHRPTVEVLVPAGGGLLARIGRGVKAVLRMRQAESGRAIQIYRMRGQREISLETMAAYQEVVDLLAAIAVDRPSRYQRIGPTSISASTMTVFRDPIPPEVAATISISKWAEHLRFFGRACRAAQARQPVRPPPMLAR